jgi:ribosomal protein S18 acetylase RimI-like enzyme
MTGPAFGKYGTGELVVSAFVTGSLELSIEVLPSKHVRVANYNGAMDLTVTHAQADAFADMAARANAPDETLRFLPVGEEAWDYCRALAQANMEPYLIRRGQRWTRSGWDEKAPSREFYELYFARERVGFVSLWRDNDIGGVHIGDIQLEARARNRGIGKAAIARIFAIARSRGLREVTLNVFRDNPAIHLYERVGFKVVDAGFDKLKMRCVL